MDWTTNPAALTPSWAPGHALLALAVVLVWGLVRERRGVANRRVVQRLYRLGEELIASRSFADSLRLLQSVLPGLLRVTEVRVYLLDRGSSTLQRVEVDTAPGLAQIPMLVEEPDGFRKKSVELCYRNRSSITVPDTRRSPLLDSAHAREAPRAAMFLPMFAQGEVLGVLAIGDARRARQFSEEKRAVAQHLANQVALGMRLLEQKSLREQAAGGETPDMIYYLVSTAAGELKKPLEHLVECCQSSVEGRSGAAGKPDADETMRQGLRAAEALSRVLNFMRLQQEQPHPVDLAAVLRGLAKLRQKTWDEGGLRVRFLVAPEPLFVASRAGTVEQAMLSLLWHVEHSLEQSREKTATLRAFRLAAMAQVDIRWQGSAQYLEVAGPNDDQGSPSEDVHSFAVCGGLIRLHGGFLKLTRSAEGEACIEVEIPLAAPEVMGSAAVPRATARPLTPLTALVLEPDPEARQTLVCALSDFGHRSVTAASAEEALELVKRLRFDILFCSSLLPGAGWPACFENSRAHVRSFVVLTRGPDPALAAALPAGEAWALGKPVRPDELNRLIEETEARGR